MHIQAHSANLNSVNPYSAASESAAAAQRAADVRKKLLKNSAAADSLSDSSDPEKSSFLAQWMNAGAHRNEGEDEYHDSASTTDSDFS